jgi:hypothetical protein
LTSYTHEIPIGKRNKAVKLTRRKIDYIIREKIRNHSTRSIAADMKISSNSNWKDSLGVLGEKPRACAHKGPGGKKKELDEESSKLMLEIHNANHFDAEPLQNSRLGKLRAQIEARLSAQVRQKGI